MSDNDMSDVPGLVNLKNFDINCMQSGVTPSSLEKQVHQEFFASMDAMDDGVDADLLEKQRFCDKIEDAYQAGILHPSGGRGVRPVFFGRG